MIKKILLSLILTFAGALTASAQEVHYIGIQGSWWNAEYAGEGFSIEEYDDGYMVAYWYTYGEMGQQMWLIGTGQRDGNSVVLDMNRTSGGVMADPLNVQNVLEEPWGTVTLQFNSCAHMDMSYETATGESGGYPLSRLLSTQLAIGECGAMVVEPQEEEPPPEEEPPVEEPPEEEPPVEEPPVEEPATLSIQLQKRSPTGQWENVDYPFTGLAVINKTYYGDPPRITLFRFRIVVEEGDLTIRSIITSEPTGIAQPSVEGILPGMTFPEGSAIIFDLESNLTGGERVYPHYNVFVGDGVEIINLTVRLSTQSL